VSHAGDVLAGTDLGSFNGGRPVVFILAVPPAPLLWQYMFEQVCDPFAVVIVPLVASYE
jgi:hypothetical protein